MFLSYKNLFPELETMTKQTLKKKVWEKPTVSVLYIKKDTFGTSGSGPEQAGKGGPPFPP